MGMPWKRILHPWISNEVIPFTLYHNVINQEVRLGFRMIFFAIQIELARYLSH
ncbi:hypothetical protein QF025_006661 [Paraburkholderia graminis]|uniref:Uncharacterized protein n=1 Tax=Paraburkholderia graminis TaxID=60548 RepID=A0ABD5CRH5_9BURK|nr:hypothetical protein [Paraburkholderia graminis]